MTAVEWFIEQIKKDINLRLRGFDLDGIGEQAKEMFEQQIIDAYIECKRQYVLQGNCYPPQFVVKEAEQYYNETFKKK